MTEHDRLGVGHAKSSFIGALRPAALTARGPAAGFESLHGSWRFLDFVICSLRRRPPYPYEAEFLEQILGRRGPPKPLIAIFAPSRPT